ncbi:hypothetical protein ACIQVT_06160 [Streptomyces sp. NPDC100445]|uniref:hypothetical protein n=1 Tax=Streptomyces sp. NPDC100445 TaxID=3366102 RepID=UPI0038202740
MAAAGLVVLATAAAVACRPGGLGSATVAYTTDRTATAALERRHVNVAWLTCTGRDGDGRTHGTSPTAGTTVVSVDCQGRTGDGRDIAVTGQVTEVVDGACVRGDLTARVGDRQVFRVDGLGDCSAPPGPTYRPPTVGRPEPTVTVTVTRTVLCRTVDPCGPVTGK